jgi:hypothetical protein
VLRLLVTDNLPSSPILVTLMMEAIRSLHKLVPTRSTWRNTPQDSILQILTISRETGIERSHYRLDKSHILVSLLSNINSVYTTHPTAVRFILILSISLVTSFNVCFSFRLSNQNHICIPLLSVRATCPTILVRLHLVIPIVRGEEYKLRRSYVCIVLHPSLTPSLFGPNILLSTLFSNTASLCKI